MCRLSNTGEKVLSNQTIEKQDPRITRTRSLILQAFERLLVEKGFHALSVQAIAEQAGIEPGYLLRPLRR